LHREALKQSATDPLSGKIDVGILTTGLSASARKKRAELIAFIKEILKKKNKAKTIPYQKFFGDVKDASQIVSKIQFYFSSISLIFKFFSSSPVNNLKML
jgi:DNA replication licensing factor MCM4